MKVDHSTLNRWVLRYAPLLEKRLRGFRKPHCGEVRIDETYIKVKGQWKYLYEPLIKMALRLISCSQQGGIYSQHKGSLEKLLKETNYLHPPI